MAEQTIEQQLEKLSQHMNRIGKEMMQHKDETYKMRGTELRVAGAMIREWTGDIKGDSDEQDVLDRSIETTDETVREETTDEVDQSKEG